eukprot:453968-Pelagomonas_calceolata.AAC.1
MAMCASATSQATTNNKEASSSRSNTKKDRTLDASEYSRLGGASQLLPYLRSHDLDAVLPSLFVAH